MARNVYGEGSNKKLVIVIVILAVLVLGAAGWIINGQVQAKKQQELQSVYTQGAIETIASVFQQTNDCQPLTLTLGEYTRQLIDVACLTG